jgi:hypothetical protein
VFAPSAQSSAPVCNSSEQPVMSLEFLTWDKPARVDAHPQQSILHVPPPTCSPPKENVPATATLPPAAAVVKLLYPVFIFINSNAPRTVSRRIACELVRNAPHSRRGRCVDPRERAHNADKILCAYIELTWRMLIFINVIDAAKPKTGCQHIPQALPNCY